jgi:hypothetical protein
MLVCICIIPNYIFKKVKKVKLCTLRSLARVAFVYTVCVYVYMAGRGKIQCARHANTALGKDDHKKRSRKWKL